MHDDAPRDARTLSIAIARDWRDLYERLWRPEVFPRWASGLSGSLTQDGERWTARGPAGAVTIRFTPHNAFGVMDHWVELGEGRQVYVPLRIVAHGEGAEVMLTLFRQPGMSAERFADDADWVRRDLTALKEFAEITAAPATDR